MGIDSGVTARGKKGNSGVCWSVGATDLSELCSDEVGKLTECNANRVVGLQVYVQKQGTLLHASKLPFLERRMCLSVIWDI